MILAFLLAASSGAAADIEVIPGENGGPAFVFYRGGVDRGDAAVFRQVTAELGDAIVMLDSRGGYIAQAMDIGATIRLRGFSTAVLSPAECYSACALIWMSGNNRYMSHDAVIGFHGAYDDSGDIDVVVGPGNALIGVYLSELGTNIEAIAFATAALPDEFRYLTPTLARAYGIDVIVAGPGPDDLVGPELQPNAVELARFHVGAVYWQNVCADLFGVVPDDVVDIGQAAMTEAMKVADAPLWETYVFRATDELNSMSLRDGDLVTCLFTEDWFRSNGADTELGGPGFDCNSARGATENAICADPQMWAEDSMMNALYRMVEARATASGLETLKDGQRGWLTVRDSCGTDLACLDGEYDRRLVVLARMAGL